jgi:poly(A) polymerase
VRDGWAARLKRQHTIPALQDAIDDVFNARIGDVSGRGKLAADMREIWMMQPRFERRTGSTPFSLVDQPRFRAGFDFMRLRADAGEIDEALAEWWQEFSTADDELRQDLLDQAREEQHGKDRKRVVKAASSAPSEADPAPQEAPAGDALSAPRKRRRRRRTGANRGDAAGAPGPESDA